MEELLLFDPAFPVPEGGIGLFFPCEYRTSRKQFNISSVALRIELLRFRFALRFVAMVLAGAAAPAAFADGKWGGSMGATSDYVSYGLSQTRGKAAIQADAHYRNTLGEGNVAVFAGAWASSLNSTKWDDANIELDAYIGGTWRIDSQSSATLTVAHYAYPGESKVPKYDYDEVTLTYGFANRLFGTIAWSPDTLRYTRFATARCCRDLSYEVEAHQPLAYRFTFAVGAGYADLADTSGYVFWNAGISRMLGNVQLDVSYIGTDSNAKQLFSETVAGSRWAASALWRFGGG